MYSENWCLSPPSAAMNDLYLTDLSKVLSTASVSFVPVLNAKFGEDLAMKAMRFCAGAKKRKIGSFVF